ncbi:MAG TPA: TldD/PmbA family protein [Bryobacteraceae bacterium]|nr:TldD/PmbA family protein [Bryobacteraceae bacterium]
MELRETPDNAAASCTLLTQEQCTEIFGRVERAARSRGVPSVEALLSVHSEALTRFANNTIHQNVSEEARQLSVRVVVDQRSARASTNRLDAGAIDDVVEQAIALARATEPDPDLLPLAEPAPVPVLHRFCRETAACSPEERARAVAEAIHLIESAHQTAAGIYSTGQGAEALFNSQGVSVYHAETLARFSITAMGSDSSGWAKASSTGRAAIDPVALARSASNKATASREPREIEAGHYTVILEPAAVLDLLGQMFWDFAATALADQRSFLTGRLGKRLFGENIHIQDDVVHPLQSGPPFDGEGVPRRRLGLVESGVPREVAYSRASAHKAGVAPTGHGFPLPNEYGEAPLNIVISGGDSSLNEMIAATGRGILVTRLWYIREVDPYEKIMTGMTRDGTFLIEGGKIAAGVKNFRFNQSLVEMLCNVESLSPAVRTSGEEAFDMVVPGMKVRDFNFTEVTRF